MPSIAETVQTAVFRAIIALPDPAKRVLAGKPVVREGQTLALDTQLMFRLQKLGRIPPAETLPWAAARRELERQSRMVGGSQTIGSVRDLTIEGPGGPLPLRLYTPAARLRDVSVPTLLFFHGGGMVYGGDHGTHDLACRALAEDSGVQLLSVDYRLAPEHPHPAAVDDAFAALEWLVAHPERVDADPDRIAVGGDSAGGFLSAVTAIKAAEAGIPLAFQLLLYPVVDFVNESASRAAFSDGFFLSREFIDNATDAFLPDRAVRSDPLVTVLGRDSFPDGLAPAYVVTAGFDPLRDEGEAYARLLEKHGVTVETKRYPSMIHGFFNMCGFGAEAPGYLREIAGVLSRALA